MAFLWFLCTFYLHVCHLFRMRFGYVVAFLIVLQHTVSIYIVPLIIFLWILYSKVFDKLFHGIRLNKQITYFLLFF